MSFRTVCTLCAAEDLAALPGKGGMPDCFEFRKRLFQEAFERRSTAGSLKPISTPVA